MTDVATWEDVDRLAMAMPEAQRRGLHGELRSWVVRKVMFAWERPLRKSDLAALGAAAPTGEILGVRVPDLGAKEAIIAADPDTCFTTPHFDGYPAVLVRLDIVDVADLEELIVEAWLARAPKRLASQYQAGH